jgi:hypothetical protein
MENDMIYVLQKKLRLIQLAANGMVECDITKAIINNVSVEKAYGFQTDFSTVESDDSLQNSISLLIANIACLKDHLKAWCKKRGHAFKGESLVNENINVSIIHDLWNIDKHMSLDYPPRSGFTPKISNLKQNMLLTTGAKKDDSITMTYDSNVGGFVTKTIGESSASIVITADVIDDEGIIRGELFQICNAAAEAWEKLYKENGI